MTRWINSNRKLPSKTGIYFVYDIQNRKDTAYFDEEKNYFSLLKDSNDNSSIVKWLDDNERTLSKEQEKAMFEDLERRANNKELFPDDLFEKEISDTRRLNWLENDDNYEYLKLKVEGMTYDDMNLTLREFIDKQLKQKENGR